MLWVLDTLMHGNDESTLIKVAKMRVDASHKGPWALPRKIERTNPRANEEVTCGICSEAGLSSPRSHRRLRFLPKYRTFLLRGYVTALLLDRRGVAVCLAAG